MPWNEVTFPVQSVLHEDWKLFRETIAIAIAIAIAIPVAVFGCTI